jgi:hypothetical protein
VIANNQTNTSAKSRGTKQSGEAAEERGEKRQRKEAEVKEC